MLNPVESISSVVSRESSAAAETAASRLHGDEVRTLAAGEVLFREGDARSHVFRVETGALCLYRSLPDGSQDVLEFAFPGDLVGLGYLDSHVSAAQATHDHVAQLPAARARSIRRSSRARARASRLTAAIEREVAFLKEALGPRARPEPAAARCGAVRDPVALQRLRGPRPGRHHRLAEVRRGRRPSRA